MKFSVNSKQFTLLLSKIILAVPAKTTNQTYEHFLLELANAQLKVSAGDGDIHFSSSINVVSQDIIGFKLLVDAKYLVQLFQSFEDEMVDLEITENARIMIHTIGGEYFAPYLEDTEYKKMEVPSGASVMTMDAKKLKRSIEKTSFATGKDQKVRPSLQGIHFDFTETELVFVATDGHVFAKYIDKDFATTIPHKLTLPNKTVVILEKYLSIGNVKIEYSNTTIAFYFEDSILISNLIGDRFPDYNNVIPIEFAYNVLVNRHHVLKSLQRMILFVGLKSNYVRVSINKEFLEINGENLDKLSTGKDKINCTFSDNNLFEIGFNPIYFKEILSHIESEEVILHLNSPSKPCVIVPKDPNEATNLLMMIMPLRMNSASSI